MYLIHVFDPDRLSCTVTTIRQVEMDPHSNVLAEALSRKWKVGLKTVQETVRETVGVTTHQGILTVVAPINTIIG